MIASDNHPESSLNWSLDQDIELPEGRSVRVLQRTVPSAETFRLDIAPLFEVSSAWVMKTSAGVARTDGRLLRYFHDDESDKFEVATAAATSWVAQVTGSRRRGLTVWRLDDQLEMIQVRVESVEESLYVQTGGQRTLAMLLDLATRTPKDATVIACMTLYETGQFR